MCVRACVCIYIFMHVTLACVCVCVFMHVTLACLFQAAAAEKALEAVLEEVKKAEDAVAERKMAFDEVNKCLQPCICVCVGASMCVCWCIHVCARVCIHVCACVCVCPSRCDCVWCPCVPVSVSVSVFLCR